MLSRIALLAALALPALEARVIVLKAAGMFDGKANAVISPGVVVVEDSRIVELGGSGELPAGAELIDLGDATLLPGFMDAHTHLRGDPAPDSRQSRIDGIEQYPAERPLIASALARKTLHAGFTTVRDLGSADFIEVSLCNAIRAGYIEGRACWSPCGAWGPRAATATRPTHSVSVCSIRAWTRPPWSTVRTRCGQPCAGPSNTAPM